MRAVLFRADASATLGAGHWTRCGALAAALRDRGVRTLLAARSPADGFALTPPAKLELIPLDSTVQSQVADANECAALLDATGAECIVVDHYGLDCEWESAMRHACPDKQLVALEDLPFRRHNASMVIAPSGTAAGEEFRTFLSSGTRYLGGPTFALLRPEFSLVRPLAIARRTFAPERCAALSVLISMGATDPEGLSLDALAGARSSGVTGSITLVLASASPMLDHVRDAIADYPAARLLVDVADMATLMAESDIGIGAAGGTSWERCAVGLPSLAVCIAANQAEVAARLNEAAAAIVIHGLRPSFDEYAEGLCALANPTTRAAISRNAAKLCDGAGARNVANQMISAFSTSR